METFLDDYIDRHKMFSVFPFKMRNSSLSICKLWLSVTLVVISVVTTVTVVICISVYYNEDDALNKLLAYLVSGFFNLIVIVHCFKVCYDIDKINNYLKVFMRVERFLNELGQWTNLKENNVLLYIQFSLIIAIFLTTCLYMEINFSTLFMLGCSLYSFVMVIVIVNQFSVVINLAKNQLDVIAQCLYRHPREYYQKSSIESTTVSRLISYQNVLITACEEINDCYSPQLFLVVSNCFVTTTTHCYRLTGHMDFLTLIVLLPRTVVAFLLLWESVASCDRCTRQVLEFYLKLNQYKATSSELEEIRATRELCAGNKRELKFMALGVFELNFKLVHTTMAAVTTYITLFVQISKN